MSDPRIPAPGRSPKEQRSQPRIKVSVRCRLVDAGGRSYPATLRDISWGGAAAQVATPLEVSQGPVFLMLPWREGEELGIAGEVLRCWHTERGQGLSLRFGSMSVEVADRLSELMSLLLRQGDVSGRRQHTRVAHRIEILYGDGADMCATLEDISEGGAMLTILPNALTVGQSIQLALGPTFGTIGIHLRARVVRQEEARYPGGQFYRVGLVFEHPTPELRSRIAEIIRRLFVTAEGAPERPAAEGGTDALGPVESGEALVLASD